MLRFVNRCNHQIVHHCYAASPSAPSVVVTVLPSASTGLGKIENGARVLFMMVS